ncbi:PadR family transcriptional regulator [Mesorhizobium sp. LjNodule214]|uniref:PadR family transcriptional regulator n=1 Tax=Mesorhizobium sp. LjNodule214 TaxID=3342252 RepID=UPI003ECC8EB9
MHRHHHFGEHPLRAFMHMAGKFGGRGGGPFGHGMRGGGRGGPGEMFRAGRMLADGDLKLITLSLLAEAPRHGYDIIKALEERTSGVYSPSPGVVYPTLTFLEEAGYATSSAEGNKKVFSITEAGQAHLEENREMIDHVLDHLERFGRKMAKARDWFGWNDDGEEGGRRGRHEKRDAFRAVRHRLRAALSDIVDAPEDTQAQAMNILQDAAEALEALSRR